MLAFVYYQALHLWEGSIRNVYRLKYEGEAMDRVSKLITDKGRRSMLRRDPTLAYSRYTEVVTAP